MHANRRPREGFTLIELLVVIAIISLLFTVMVPSLLRARLLAMQTICMTNLNSIGRAASTYQSDHRDYVPICWGNLDASNVMPWKSWRTNLLSYTKDFRVFNCPAAVDSSSLGEVFHSADEITGQDNLHTLNAGSYGIMYQFSLPSYKAVNSAGVVAQGHPMWSLAFPVTPGVAWQDPGRSVYVADAYLARGPLKYPSESTTRYGTSAIVPPSEAEYTGNSTTRRFADRHLGSNCLLVGGQVLSTRTEALDQMQAGSPDCIWDVK